MGELSVRRVFGHAADSLELVRTQVLLPRPVPARDIAARYVQDVVFNEPLVTAGGVALGGHHALTVNRQGGFRYAGHFRATGWPSYDVSIVTTLGYTVALPDGSRAGAQAAFTAHGRVHGSNESGDREYAWDQVGSLPILATEWQGVRQGTLSHNLQYDTDWFGTVGGVASFLAQVVALGTVFGAAGVAIVVATEAAEILNMEELVVPGLVGIMFAGAACYVFGPSMLLPAFIAGAVVTAALIKQRHLTEEEKTFAAKVFGDSLPVDRILLTNLLGLGGAPFCTAVPGGTILVNLGDGYDDPRNYTGLGNEGTDGRYAPGELFIHELTHAWQIGVDSFTPEYFCRSIGTAAFGGLSAYHYGPATENWGGFGTEGQARLVDEWFAGRLKNDPRTNQHTYDPIRGDEPPDTVTGPANPYFRYIRDNIRPRIT